jgi:hypothetical protein
MAWLARREVSKGATFWCWFATLQHDILITKMGTMSCCNYMLAGFAEKKKPQEHDSARLFFVLKYSLPYAMACLWWSVHVKSGLE